MTSPGAAEQTAVAAPQRISSALRAAAQNSGVAGKDGRADLRQNLLRPGVVPIARPARPERGLVELEMFRRDALVAYVPRKRDEGVASPQNRNHGNGGVRSAS